MAATLLTLRDQVIIDAGIAGNPDFPTARLNREINLAQRYVQMELNGLGAKKWETNQDITAGLTAAGYSAAASPGNCKKVTIGTYFANLLESPKSILNIEVNDGTNYGIANEVGVDFFKEHINNSLLVPTVKEAIFMRLSNSVYIAPVGIISAKANYWKAITDLASDTDITEIPMEFEEFIVKKTVLEINGILGKLTDKQMASQQLQSDLNSSYEKFLGKMQESNRIQVQQKSKLS